MVDDDGLGDPLGDDDPFGSSGGGSGDFDSDFGSGSGSSSGNGSFDTGELGETGDTSLEGSGDGGVTPDDPSGDADDGGSDESAGGVEITDSGDEANDVPTLLAPIAYVAGGSTPGVLLLLLLGAALLAVGVVTRFDATRWRALLSDVGRFAGDIKRSARSSFRRPGS